MRLSDILYYWIARYMTACGMICWGGKGGGAPSPDPNVGIAALESAKTGQKLENLAEQNFAWNQQQYNDMAPLVKGVINSQINAQNTATNRANQEWENYQSLYEPVEKQFVQQASSYATPEKQAEEAALAGANVSNAYDQQEGVARRNLERRGLSPAAMASFETGAGLSKAADVANAENTARRNTELQGLSNLETITNIGLNRPATSVAQNQLALNSGNSAVGNTSTLQNQGNVGYSNALQGYGAGLQAYGQQGNLGQAITADNLKAYGINQQANSSALGGLGSLIGTGISAYGLTHLSSKHAKTDKRPVSADAIVAGLRKVPVEKWRYKPGLADSGEHIGPYAEDMHREFGDAVAPGGKAIDVPSGIGLSLAGIKALDKRVSKLEKGKRHG